MTESALLNAIGQLGIPAAVLYYILREHTRRLDTIRESLIKNRIILWLIAEKVGVSIATTELAEEMKKDDKDGG